MDQLIATLTNLLNLTKIAAVSVPGLLSACAIAILMLPPAPIDLVPIVVPRKPTISDSKLPRQQEATASHLELSGQDVTSDWEYLPRACDIELIAMPEALEVGPSMATGTPTFAAGSSGVPPSGGNSLLRNLKESGNSAWTKEKRPPVQYQLLLDSEQIRLAECVGIESALKNLAKARIDRLSAQLTAMQAQARVGQSSAADVNRIRSEIQSNEQDFRNREENLAYLATYSQIVAARMADPGRLRPRLNFDAYMELLTHHVIGFILLSIALGIVVTSLTSSLFTLLYESWPT